MSMNFWEVTSIISVAAILVILVRPDLHTSDQLCWIRQVIAPYQSDLAADFGALMRC